MKPLMSSGLGAAAIMLICSTLQYTADADATSREHVIYLFSVCAGPTAPLVADRNVSLYGTTLDGGSNEGGCAFELSRNTDGSWRETLLHNFGGSDGTYPSAGLILDQSGNLYGTTEGGGAYGGGVAFELTSSANGEWTETVLYNFGNGDDGFAPRCSLLFDNDGNLYGTTDFGGKHRGGTVFKLSPGPNGWSETILYSFWSSIAGPGGDGPMGGVVLDHDGNLYGVTIAGGTYGLGAVYELTPKNGSYAEHLIHSFNEYEGALPKFGLTMDSSGNLYGTTAYGGINDFGIVFQLTRGAKGKWIENVVHFFDGNDGFYPVGPVFVDDDGNLYAATQSGGGNNAFGTVYKITHRQSGLWTETTLHVFRFYYLHGNGDGLSPYAGVILHGGVLYGTTSSGGVNNEGTVFSITLRHPDAPIPGSLP